MDPKKPESIATGKTDIAITMAEIDEKDRKNRIQLKEYYVRVGTDYYFKGFTLTAKKDKIPLLRLWKAGTIKDDYPGVNDWKRHIEKYLGFVNVPDNGATYERAIGDNDQPFKSYNRYEQLEYKPIEGVFNVTELFLKHIFGSYFNVGLDYLTILYTDPTQQLPILSLVSRERKTGKSTFLKWLVAIFGGNAIILGNEDISGHFNSHWVSKLVIGLDETFIEKKETLEKIKRLATDDTVLNENKGKDKNRLDFFGKFILLSNDETNFVQLQEEENRYFIIKVPHIELENPTLLDSLKIEIPAFIYFLQTRAISHPKLSRLWFEPSVYTTDALRKVVVSSRTKVEKAIIGYLTDIYNYLDDDLHEDRQNPLYVIPKHLAKEIREDMRSYNGLEFEVEKVLKENWNLRPSDKASRKIFYCFGTSQDIQTNSEITEIKETSKLGRHYEITRSFIEGLNKNT